MKADTGLSGLSGLVSGGGGSTSTLLNNLVAYYKLEEATGTRVDATGRGNDLTPTNTPGNAAGIQGNALSLAVASSQYLSRADTADLEGGGAKTIAAWVYPTSNQSEPCIISKGDLSNNNNVEYDLELDSLKPYVLVGKGTSFYFFSWTTTIPLNTWSMLMFWIDPSNTSLNLSVNNAAPVSQTYTGTLYTSNNEFRIGSYATRGGFYFDGRIDEVGIWNRVLTSTEMTNLYDAGAGQTYPFTGVP